MALPKDPITIAPALGAILKCHFDGFVSPEMLKSRPVLVIAPPIKQRPKLCTIIPLSTTIPDPEMPYHLEIAMPTPLLPAPFDSSSAWVKADMLYAVSFNRLERFYHHTGKSKKYIIPVIKADLMKEIQRRVLRGLGLRFLEKGLR